MKAESTVNEVEALRAKLETGVAGLRAQRDEAAAKLASLDAEIARQKALFLPPEELKAAIIETLVQRGEAFADAVRGYVAEFARHKHGMAPGVTLEQVVAGQPMRFADAEAMLGNKIQCYEHTNVLKAGGTQFQFDAPIAWLLGDLIPKRLKETIAAIEPAAMGYDKVRESDIGCGRAERRALIADLEAQRADVAAKLEEVSRALGIVGSNIEKALKRPQ